MRLYYQAIEKKDLNSKETILLISRISKNFQEHKNSMSRLLDILKANDKNSYHLEDYGVKLSQLHKNDEFNTPPVILFKKHGFPKRGKEFRLRAIQRLSKYLTNRDKDGYYFCGSYDFNRVGNVVYSQFSTTIEYLTDQDKLKYLKNKIRGQKATLTKAINEAFRIRKGFLNSLFPDAYKTDNEYIRLIKKIKDKRQKLSQVKKLSIDNIPSISKDLTEIEIEYIKSLFLEKQLAA